MGGFGLVVEVHCIGEGLLPTVPTRLVSRQMMIIPLIQESLGESVGHRIINKISEQESPKYQSFRKVEAFQYPLNFPIFQPPASDRASWKVSGRMVCLSTDLLNYLSTQTVSTSNDLPIEIKIYIILAWFVDSLIHQTSYFTKFYQNSFFIVHSNKLPFCQRQHFPKA